MSRRSAADGTASDVPVPPNVPAPALVRTEPDPAREDGPRPILEPTRISYIRGAWRRADARFLQDGSPEDEPTGSAESTAAADARYRDLLENAIEGVFRTTASGRTLSINEAGARMFGYESPTEMLSLLPNVSSAWLDPEQRSEFVDRVSAHGSVSDFEYQVRRRDGSTGWLSINAHAVSDPRINELCIEGMLVDVTRRRRAEQELRESRELHESIFAHIAEGVAYCEIVYDDAGLPIDYVHLEVTLHKT